MCQHFPKLQKRQSQCSHLLSTIYESQGLFTSENKTPVTTHAQCETYMLVTSRKFEIEGNPFTIFSLKQRVTTAILCP